jgi:hypothetical protein
MEEGAHQNNEHIVVLYAVAEAQYNNADSPCALVVEVNGIYI